MSQSFPYPPARRDDVVDNFHGTAVPDPYRWLEAPESADTQAWVAAQNNLTRAFLDQLPQRADWQRRLTELWNYPRYSVPQRKGNRYFFYKNDGLQNQAVLYRQEQLGSESVELLDPNQLSPDGTVAITSQAFSEDGRRFAYGLSSSGSDRQIVRVRDVDTAEDFAEELRWCRFAGIAWHHNGAGFFYNRDPEPGTVPPEDEYRYNRLYWHELGTPQSADRLVYERPDAPDLAFPPMITDDGRYLVLHPWHAAINKNRLYVRAVDGDGDFIRLVDEPDAYYHLVGNNGRTFYVQTDWQAPNGRIVAIHLDNPAHEKWQTLIPEGPDPVDFALIANEQLVIVTLHNACHRVTLYDLDGRPTGDIPLPAPGTITALSGRPQDSELFFSFESFLYPNVVLRYDFATGALTRLREPAIAFNPDDYQTTQVFYPSKDGAPVSLFISHKKGIRLDGRNPTLLYGYGGFNVSQTPVFSVSQLAWLERGGVFALANLRGGSEYGEAWHEAGMLGNKQNVFDDFIAAAEWLIDAGYTRPAHLGIMGRSNGGLLVAACMLQRPDLFGAVACIVPVTDMLRYHLFTAGRYWVAEYGDPADPTHFPFLYAYSPLHNVRPGIVYPSTLITTAETDDRVVPMHAKKFAATLQAANPDSPNPVLIRVETGAGHGLGKPTAKLIAEQSDIYAFLSAILE